MSKYHPSGPTAEQMSDKLRQAHARLHQCILEMERLTSRNVAEQVEIAAARYRISRASMSRRAAFTEICQVLRASLADADRAALFTVIENDRSNSKSSADHVTRWSADRIRADWPGYCRASKAIRREMLKQVALEVQLLLPMLQRRRFDSCKSDASA